MNAATRNPLEDLARKIQFTARIRYIAARRLEYHRRLSGWVIALASLALILIPLVQAAGGQPRYSASTLATLQVGLAVFILVYSIFLASEDFSLRSYKMQQCGNQLSHLARELDALVESDVDSAKHERFNETYTRILNAHENHRYVDYLNDKLQKPEEYFTDLPEGQSRKQWLKTAGSAALRYFLGFLHYAIFLIFLLFVIGQVLV